MKKNHDAMLRTGAMALAAAGASTAAHAATVQITFNNSFVSTTSGITALDTDFGGDNVGDIRGGVFPRTGGLTATVATMGNTFFGPPNWVGRGGGNGVKGFAWLPGMGTGSAAGGVATRSGIVSFTLVDAAVRTGAPTAGWVDLTATGRSAGEFGRVDVYRFIFDDASGVAPTGVSHASGAFPEYVAAVPEPSGLGLLALGAGGLLARRRRAMAA